MRYELAYYFNTKQHYWTPLNIETRGLELSELVEDL